MHVKDLKASTRPNFAFRMDPADVGSGTMNWKALLPAAYAHGVRDFFVEQEPPFDKPRMESVRIVPEGSQVANYGFDVTPARLVTGLITERGVLQPNRAALAGAFPERAARG